MNKEALFDLDKLIDTGKYGPRGFLEEGDNLAKRYKLSTGLLDVPNSKPGKIDTFVYVVGKATVIMPTDGIFPECKVLTTGTVIPKLVCFADPERCTVGKDCLGTLLNRLGSLSSVNPEWALFVLYWEFKNRLMGLVIRAKDSNMRMISINPHALDYYILRGEKYRVQI